MCDIWTLVGDGCDMQIHTHLAAQRHTHTHTSMCMKTHTLISDCDEMLMRLKVLYVHAPLSVSYLFHVLHVSHTNNL